MSDTLNYKIEILSDWHIGSGLDSATDTDALVLKNEQGLPYIPGKTIKGLMKDAMMDLVEVGQCDQSIVDKIFGKMKKEEDRTEDESKISSPGTAFFSNVSLTQIEQREIQSNNLGEYLYRNIASTAIEKNGMAKDKSLRVMQVCIPLSLEGTVTQLEEYQLAKLEVALKLIRHLGVNRNRGLGRCKFSCLNTNS